jgi:hypothetical protein
MGWTAVIRFPEDRDIPLYHQTHGRSGENLNSCPKGTGGYFLEVKKLELVELPTDQHILPRSRIKEALPPCPLCTLMLQVFTHRDQ